MVKWHVIKSNNQWDRLHILLRYLIKVLLIQWKDVINNTTKNIQNVSPNLY